jgi:hypothetical protein
VGANELRKLSLLRTSCLVKYRPGAGRPFSVTGGSTWWDLLYLVSRGITDADNCIGHIGSLYTDFFFRGWMPTLSRVGRRLGANEGVNCGGK